MLKFQNKTLRADVIKRHMEANGYAYAICFSCGNASAALKDAGIPTLAIAPNGDLAPNRWFLPDEIARIWPGPFDATSGHLPVWLMHEIGMYYREQLGDLGAGPILVPCGSGETLVCLAMAYPGTKFIAVYDNSRPETTFEERAPLNALVKALAYEVHNGAQD